jgi:hypothetical protein
MTQHETAHLLPHRYPEGFILQLDAQEVPALQDKRGQCETVYKAAAGSFFNTSNRITQQRWPF